MLSLCGAYNSEFSLTKPANDVDAYLPFSLSYGSIYGEEKGGMFDVSNPLNSRSVSERIHTFRCLSLTEFNSLQSTT